MFYAIRPSTEWELRNGEDVKRWIVIPGLFLAAALVYVDRVLPGQVERDLNARLSSTLPDPGEAARALHADLFVADLHSDSMLWKRDFLKRSDVGHMDVPRLGEGNVALQVFSATTKSPAGQNYRQNAADARDNITLLAVLSFWPPGTWTSLYERAVFQLERLKDYSADSDLELVESAADLRALIERRERGEAAIGAVYLIEGAHPLEGDVANLDRLFEKGLRIAGLTHFFDNELGGSLHGLSGEGLSDFGRDVVRRANELGVIVDVAHASSAMVEDVLDLSTRPVVLSHGGLKGICNTPRNLDDDLMRRIAEAGGLVGIGFWAGAVCDPSPDGVAASIRYAVDLLGIDHVALGSDYDGSVAVTFDAGELVLLTDALLRTGFDEAEIRAVMGANLRRFLLENLP